MQLGDLTQTRPEAIDPDSRAEVTLSVELHGYSGLPKTPPGPCGRVCQPQLGSRTRVMRPAQVSGPRAERRRQPCARTHQHETAPGCVDDATIDRVRGELDSVVVLET